MKSGRTIDTDVLWPVEGLAEALAALGRRCGLHVRARPMDVPLDPMQASEFDAWVDSAVRWLGLEAEAVEARYQEIDLLIRRAGPALLRLPDTHPPRFIALATGGWRHVTVLAPDLTLRKVNVRAIRAVLCAPLELPLEEAVERLLDEGGVVNPQRQHSRALLLEQLLATRSIGGCWLVRAGDASPVFARLGGARFVRRVSVLVGAQMFQYALYMLSWWLIAWIALTDRFDTRLLALWALLYISVTPLRLYTYVAAGNLSIDLGARLKRLYLGGAFKLDPNEIRHMGAGQLLGRTLEIEAIEAFSFTGALYLLIGASELVFVGIIFALGAGGWWQVAALATWVIVATLVSAAYFRERSRWTDERLEITNGLVEQIVGHRTRLAQDPDSRWGIRDDQSLQRYHLRSARLNRYEVALQTLLPRGWFVVSIAAVIPEFVGVGATSAGLAAAMGGVLIGYHAFQMLGGSLEQLVGALVARKQLAPLLQAVHRPEIVGSPRIARRAPAGPEPGAGAAHTRRPVLDARGLVFRHPERSDDVLRDTNLQVFSRDRILLEGASGAGKSTLASVLAACRPPQAGIVLLDGLDPATVGHRRWRQRVVHVPQFHENHVLTGSFAFNLLMGRGWPPTQEDMRQAEHTCRSLGLDYLLRRMPGGLFEIVGDTGWQLSHGERSRLFAARAILQRPAVTILDESLAALDPDALLRAVECMFECEGAVIVIAHP